MLTKYIKALSFSVLIFCGLSRPAVAQTQFAGWAATFQNYKLSPRVGFYFDAQYRSTDQWKQLNALLLRPGINFYFMPALTGTVGYAFIPQQRMNAGVEGYLPEHRVWEQMTFVHPVKLGAGHAVARHHAATMLSHRLRLEQRYLPKHHAENGQLVQDGHRYGGRLRYFARAVVPLSGPLMPAAEGKPVVFTNGWFAAVQNEVFFNVDNGKPFDQNRAYLAAGYRLNKQFDLEMGYMNQYISGAGSNYTNNHIVQVATYLRL